MPNITLKQAIIVLLTIIGIILITFFLLKHKTPEPISLGQTPKPSTATQNESPKIISTKPDPLNDAIIPADQVIEITFNRSLQNAPEFKVKIEPKIDFKVELSQDRKTAKILPAKPYELGSSYTLYIGPDTKFDGAGNWGMDKSFHFRTIKYTGI